jgi:hypothetical protein
MLQALRLASTLLRLNSEPSHTGAMQSGRGRNRQGSQTGSIAAALDSLRVGTKLNSRRPKQGRRLNQELSKMAPEEAKVAIQEERKRSRYVLVCVTCGC